VSSEPAADSKPMNEVDLVLETIVQRYPDERLTEKHLTAIRGDISFQFELSHYLARYPLQNSDEPAFIVAAWRAPAVDGPTSNSK